MESICKADLKSASSDSGSSDLDENDDAFFNELFTGSAPSIEAAETAPWLDDSDTEISADAMVKFYIDNSMAVAEIDGTRHQIGFLDLTDEEHSCLSAITETTVEMSVNEKCILLQNQKFNIKRIQEYENTIGSYQKEMESMFEELNLHRVQFSSSEPFLAKYQNDIYFVGKRLCVEYLLLLNRTNQQPGTSIRISKKRLTVDRSRQVLDIKQAVDFKKPNEICIIVDTNESSTTTSSDNVRPINVYRRFVMSPSTWTLLEVEASLIHSSIYDVCTEIYAELNFPFTEPKPKSDEVQPQTEKLSRKERKRERALKHEERMKENDKKKQNESRRNSSKSSSFSSPEVAHKSSVEKKSDAQSGKAMRTLVFSNSSNARNESARSENSGPFQMEDLKPYAVSEDVKAYLSSGAPLSFVDRASAMTDKQPVKRMANYLIASDIMIELEEAEHTRYLEKFVQKNVRLKYCGDNQFSFTLADEMGEIINEIENNSIQFAILRPSSSPETLSSQKVEGKICDFKDKKVLIDVTKAKSFNSIRESCESELFDISFKLNRLSYKLQHYALEFMLDHELFVRLVDNSDYRSTKPPENKRVSAKATRLRNSDGTQLQHLNNEQYSAVVNILFSSKTHLPYLLLGPPGTGKTHTLVALIEQIVRTTNQNVLFCAPTHNACDEMVYHLAPVLQAGEMYRFYAMPSKHSLAKPQVLEVSNFTGTTVSYPPLNTLYKYRVVICTVESAGFLTRARIDKDWNGQNFKYVIIDDSASAHETMTFIPIAGLCTSKKKLHAKIILCGDPKQALGPATRSKIRIDMGYNKSWLSHLCRTKLYSRNDESGKFNDSFVTYLNKNYRSHPQVLHIPNELFYENAMQPLAKSDDVGWYLNTSILPSKQFPFIFKAVQGNCQRAIGYNWTNDAEVDEVVSIVKRLLPPNSKTEGLKRIAKWQIGIVSPFHSQNYKIVQALQALKLGKVDVGTAESFQGKEKPVMIISTVRSASEPFNFDVPDSEILECVAPFAKSEWLNAMINRGKCLVIIIGDPQMLKENTKWKWLIERCIHHGSFQGDYMTFYSENIRE